MDNPDTPRASVLVWCPDLPFAPAGRSQAPCRGLSRYSSAQRRCSRLCRQVGDGRDRQESKALNPDSDRSSAMATSLSCCIAPAARIEAPANSPRRFLNSPSSSAPASSSCPSMIEGGDIRVPSTPCYGSGGASSSLRGEAERFQKHPAPQYACSAKPGRPQDLERPKSAGVLVSDPHGLLRRPAAVPWPAHG